MIIKTKKVSGKLFGRENGELLANVQVEISLITPTNLNDYPEYKDFITTENFRPELDGKINILKINENISGEVFLSMESSYALENKLAATFQGSSWLNLEWFNSL